MTSLRLARMNTASCASVAPPGLNTALSAHSATARSLHHTYSTVHTLRQNFWHHLCDLHQRYIWNLSKYYTVTLITWSCIKINCFFFSHYEKIDHNSFSLSFPSEWTHLLLSGSFVPLAAVHHAKGVCTVVLHLKETHCFHHVPNRHLYTKCKLCIIPNWWPRMSLFISATKKKTKTFCPHTEVKASLLCTEYCIHRHDHTGC